MRRLFLVGMLSMLVVGCATVDVTKTGKGYYTPTNPSDVEILKTLPNRPYEEVGTVSAMKFDADESAKMHNAIRVKAAPLGANAVVLTDEGIWDNGRRWATGVALHYKDEKK